MENCERIDNHVNSDNLDDSDEEIIDWEKEAEAIIRDVKDHVKEIFISEKLTSNNFRIFLNIQTLELEKYCVQVSGVGFQIVGNDYDKCDIAAENEDNIFETPYALLTKISNSYIQSFANRLSQQISNLIQN